MKPDLWVGRSENCNRKDEVKVTSATKEGFPEMGKVSLSELKDSSNAA